MKKLIVLFVALFLLLCPFLQAQTWNAPITVTDPYSGIGGNLGQYSKLLVVNGNPAMATYDATRGDLLFFRATNASGTAWTAPVAVDVAGTVGQHISFQIVNGNPAISYYAAGSDGGDLKYVRANNANGTAWAAPVTIDVTGDVGQYTSMQVVSGNPALSYYDDTNNKLKYVRATNASGSAWGTPVFPDITTTIAGQYTSLQIVNGNPAIAYYYFTYGALKYVRATDASGTAWAEPVTVDDLGSVGQYCSMQVVNGKPAISYYDDYPNKNLKYVRATDSSGRVWGSPVTVDSTGDVGLYTSLQIVKGNPAIAYFDNTRQLKYVRSTDASGTAWATPVTLDAPTYFGGFSSLQIVNDNPAISYYAWSSGLQYLRATDVSGTSWAAPISFRNTGFVGQYNSLQVVNSVPAISYYSNSFYGDLIYVHASNASGSEWATPVYADVTGKGKYSSLLEVNGNPAIAYYDDFNTPAKLKYRRATDASGTAWATPVSVGVAGNVPTKCSMQIVNGNPAISYYDAFNGNLKYVRATDANGVAWAAPVSVDSIGNVGQSTSLRIVNGNPAISYYSTAGKLKYVRATDASGTAWAAPVTVENNFFDVAWQAYYSLEIVNGNPAISYYNANGYLKYVRATDANGTAWAASVSVDTSGNVGQWTSMQVVNGKPAISYYDKTNKNLKYVHATDVSGAAWAAPVSLDTTGDVGQYNSMQIINGNPAISYYDATNRVLKYVRASINSTLEAEQAVLNGAVVASNQPGFTGSGFADYVNASGDFIEWTVNTSVAGSFSLQFRYANGAAANRPLQLKVNGVVVVASLAFSPTGGWATWSVSSSVANLIAGANKVRLTTIGSNGPNVDHLAFSSNSTLEAEQAVLNGAVIASNQPGFTGSGYVDYINASGDFIEWTVNASAAGSFSLQFRYANGAATNRPLQLKVNGVVVVASLAFSPTGGWATWSVSSSVANLITGTNKVRLSTIGSNGPNVDHLALKAVVGQPGTLEAEQAVLNGAVVASNQPGFTGSGYADYINASGDFIEWTVNAPAAGSFSLQFRYANGAATNRSLKLEINGVVVAGSLSFSPTGGWTVWSGSSATANLITGTNKVRLTTIGSNGPNVDHLAFSSNNSIQSVQRLVLEKKLLPASSELLRAYVAPNPVDGTAKLILSTSSNLPIDIQLVDMSGKKYRSLKFGLRGSNTFDFPVNDLPPGYYTIILKQGNLSTHAKLIVGRK